MDGGMPRRNRRKVAKKSGFSDPKWEAAFEESFKRNEEALRRLAKL
jgi:hypothetical protein